MSLGTGTTLVLHPTGRDAIIFDQSARTGASEGYVIDAGSLRFNEERRIEIVYGGEGGEFPIPVDETANLADVTFTTLISSASWAGMMGKLEALQLAVHNAQGGTLEYLPEGAAAGTRSTFYHYVQSPIPALRQRQRNRIDRGFGGGSVFHLEVDVTLRTWPVATSDPDNLVQVLTSETIYNVGDGSQDYVTIDGDDVPGSLPALARFLITPGAGGASSIGRFWMARRTTGLADFAPTLLSDSSAHITAAGAWSTVIDATRCGGDYVRCTPVQNEIEYGRRFTIVNWDDHRGRAALAAVVKASAGDTNDWSIYYGWTIGNTVNRGTAQRVAQTDEWEVLLLGEPDLPETEMSDIEDLDLYVDVLVKRNAGTGTLSLDAIKLLFTDECALQVEPPAGYGTDDDHALLIENTTGEELAHVIDGSNKLTYLASAKGNYPTIEPGKDNRFDVAWERYRGAAVHETFEDYGDRWKQIASFEDPEEWTGSSPITIYDTDLSTPGAYVCEDGTGSQKAAISGGSVSMACTLPSPVSLAAFETGDFITLGFLALYDEEPSAISLTLTLKSDDNNYYAKTFTVDVQAYWQVLSAKLSAFSDTAYPSWQNVSEVTIGVSITGGTSVQVYLDDLRACKADPDDANTFNVTGTVWNGEALAEGSIATQDGETYFYTEETLASGYDALYLASALNYSDLVVTVKLWIDESPSGISTRIWFRATDMTKSYEDGYAWSFYTGGVSSVSMIEEGAAAALASARISVPTRQWLYAGIIAHGDSIRCFLSTSEAELFSPQSLVFSVEDSTYTGTLFGLGGGSAGVRYADVKIQNVKDLHVPGDSASLDAYALFRTIYPFYE